MLEDVGQQTWEKKNMNATVFFCGAFMDQQDEDNQRYRDTPSKQWISQLVLLHVELFKWLVRTFQWLINLLIVSDVNFGFTIVSWLGMSTSLTQSHRDIRQSWDGQVKLERPTESAVSTFILPDRVSYFHFFLVALAVMFLIYLFLQCKSCRVRKSHRTDLIAMVLSTRASRAMQNPGAL